LASIRPDAKVRSIAAAKHATGGQAERGARAQGHRKSDCKKALGPYNKGRRGGLPARSAFEVRCFVRGARRRGAIARVTVSSGAPQHRARGSGFSRRGRGEPRASAVQDFFSSRDRGGKHDIRRPKFSREPTRIREVRRGPGREETAQRVARRSWARSATKGVLRWRR